MVPLVDDKITFMHVKVYKQDRTWRELLLVILIIIIIIGKGERAKKKKRRKRELNYLNP